MKLLEFLAFLREGVVIVLYNNTTDITKCFEKGDRVSMETLCYTVTSVTFSYKENIVYIDVEE